MLDRSRSRDRSKTGGAFSPAGLFVTGAQGAWYDPSDFSTLFQDAAGTTPVTAVEQPVRLMLDRSGRGNNATAPNDASRPILRARYNLLTRSEEFDNAAWTKLAILAFGSGSVANAAVAPDGTTTADLIVADTTSSAQHGVFQNVTAIANARYTHSVYAKAAGYDFLVMTEGNNVTAQASFNLATGALGTVIGTGSPVATITPVGNGWHRCTLSLTPISTSQNVQARAANADGGPTFTGDGTSGILIWGAQLLTSADQTSTGGAYQRIAAATDYDVSNPVFRPYLAFDGTDDSFGTSAIDFSGTDEMTVFAGLTKLSDAALGILLELSNTLDTNNGSFYVAAPVVDGTNNYQFRSKGTAGAGANYTNVAVAAPITNVVTGIGDIGGDVATLRVNGAQVATSATDQGTGNFGNYPLFIGRRNNTNLPFNGRLYSLAVLGRTATAPELSAMETYVAGKTGVTL